VGNKKATDKTSDLIGTVEGVNQRREKAKKAPIETQGGSKRLRSEVHLGCNSQLRGETEGGANGRKMERNCVRARISQRVAKASKATNWVGQRGANFNRQYLG